MVTTGKWEPIKTVPLNKPVMLTDGEIIVIGICRSYRAKAGFEYLDGIGFNSKKWDWNFSIEDLTHWMALPLLPEKPFIR